MRETPGRWRCPRSSTKHTDPPEPAPTTWLDLTPVLSDDGVTLTVRARRSGDCKAAMDEHRAREGAGIPMGLGVRPPRGVRVPGALPLRQQGVREGPGRDRSGGAGEVSGGAAVATPPGTCPHSPSSHIEIVPEISFEITSTGARVGLS
jgi:hypothetical protein